MFPLTGFVPARRMRAVKGRVLLQGAAVTTVVVVLTALLTGRTIDAASQAEDVAAARRLVNSWLTGTGLELTDLAVRANQVTISVAGPDAPPEPSNLARQLTEVLGGDTDLEIQWLQRSSIAANGSGLHDVDPAVIDAEIASWLTDAGEDPGAFTVDILVEPRAVVVAITGPVAPPDQGALERRLRNRLGIAIPVTIDATVTVPDADTRQQLEIAGTAAATWAAERGQSVASVSLDEDVATIVVEGPAPPTEASTLQTRLSADLQRPIELHLRHRTVTTIPTEAAPVFRWPLDCAAAATPPTVTPASRGFTGTPLGVWLADRLAATSLRFIDDGSTFALDYVDGTLHVWAVPADPAASAPRREITATNTGPRQRELRSATVGTVAIVAEVVPHDLDHAATARCLPSTAELDTWFTTLATATAASPFTGALEGYRPGGATMDSPVRHLLRVSAAAQVPVSVTATGDLTVLVDARNIPLVVTTRLSAGGTGGTTVRAGGLTIAAGDRSTAISAFVDRLAAALATEPYLGPPALG